MQIRPPNYSTSNLRDFPLSSQSLTMAHLPVEGEDEKYYEMITISPPPLEFGDFTSASNPESMAARELGPLGTRISENEYAQFLEQNLSFQTQKNPVSQYLDFPQDLNLQAFQYDPGMYANPNQKLKVESPNLLSPPSLGVGQRSQNREFLTTQSLYSDAASNSNSLFHDAASHFSGAAEPPSNLFEQQHPDSFNQEIGLGGSISSTNLANMNFSGSGGYSDNVYNQTGYYDTQKYPSQEYQANDLSFHLGNELGLNSESLRYDYSQQNQGISFPGVQDPYSVTANRLTEDNLLNYNGKVEGNEAPVTISIHQAPEQVAARTPSLFSNSSHNSSPGKKQQDYSGNQLQPPGQNGRSRSPSLSLNPQSPSQQSWNNASSPTYSANLPSPGGSLYSDIDADNYLRPEDFNNMRRGRQSAHLFKTRSQLHSRSRSRSHSRTGLVHSGADYFENESDFENGDNVDDSQAAHSSREKMLELASSASVSKRTQIHPSSYACHLCEKKFTRPYNLKSHLRTHTDDRPFICNVCGKAFARQHDRKRHEELHSGEKKYQCRGVLRDGTPFGCGRKFARADALRRHFQTDSGRECIKLLVEEDAREQNTSSVNSGIQLPDGEFMNPNAPEIPVVSVLPPQ